MPGHLCYPRPEYPRPDRQRGTVEGYDWLNLNGPWQFRFDGERKGLKEKWFALDPIEWREQIIVPFCWESLAAWGEADAAGNDNYYSTRVFINPLEVTRANHRSALRYDVGWYRRWVEIPSNPAWEDKRVILTIGAADFFTDCWCNGVHLGHHDGGYTPFEFDLTDALAERSGETGTNRSALVVLRVEDPMDNSEQPVGKQWRWYTTTSGVWQTVFIEPRNHAYIKSFRITPDIDDGTAHFSIECPNAKDGSAVKIRIFPPEHDGKLPDHAATASVGVALAISSTEAPPDASTSLSSAGAAGKASVKNKPAWSRGEEVVTYKPVGSKSHSAATVHNQTAEQLIKLDSPKLWDPNSPYLYPVILELTHNGKTLDTIRTYFGLRKIDFELSQESGTPTALRLNGDARYLRGALYQSYHPDGVYTATSQQTLKNDILAAKKFGFNFLRVHIKIDDPILLYWADKLGILLMADFPNFGEGGDTLLGRKRFETMMREGIERDFNHPAIFAWCLFNETWGFGGQNTFLDKLLAPVPGMDKTDIEKRAAEPLAPAPHTQRGTLEPLSPAPQTERGASRPAAHRRATEISKEPLDSEVPIGAAAGRDVPRSARLRNVQEVTVEPPSARRLSPLTSHLLPPLTRPQVWVQKMWELAKKLDPTRLVEDMSVCHWDHLEYYQHCDTDINSWHFYINDYQKAKAHIDKIVASTFVGSTFNYVPGFVHKGQPLINSEYGGIGALDGDRDVSWSFKFLTNELRRHQQIAAYIYTELHDVEWEYNGFLNYDRTEKAFGYDPRIVNESNALPVDAPPVQKVAPGQTVRLEVSSAHFSTRRHENVSLFWRLGGIDTRGRLKRDLEVGRVPIPFPDRQVAHAHTIEMRMPGETMLCTLLLEARDPDGTAIAFNYLEYFVSAAYPPDREEVPREASVSLPGIAGSPSEPNEVPPFEVRLTHDGSTQSAVAQSSVAIEAFAVMEQSRLEHSLSPGERAGGKSASDAPVRDLVLRGFPGAWARAEWSGGMSDRDKERAEDCSYGFGHGFFEWDLPLHDVNLRKTRRIKLICEASSHRVDAPQTDEDICSTTLAISLNGVTLYKGTLRNHPHDARGVLSYWRGGLGGYGYLVHAVAEKKALEEIAARSQNHHLQVRFEVPADALAQGGLTLYGAECGRFPVSPTVVIEW